MTAYEVGRAAWPEIKLPRARFATFLTERGLSPEAKHGADLYLACACHDAIPAALAAFERTQLERLPVFLAKLQPTPSFIDELKQLMREKLFVGQPPRIAEYSGKGPLGAWLRIVVLRVAIDLKRARGERTAPHADAHDAPDSQTSPELQALRNRYRPIFAAAFQEALAGLSVQERDLIRWHFVDGVSMDELGKRLKLNRTTVFRRIKQCMAALNRAIREQVRQKLPVSTAEFDSLAQVIDSEFEMSLSDLLRSRY